MARPSTYDFSFLKQYKGISVIYALYTNEHGIKYVGHSKDVYRRFYNHLINHSSEKNRKKYNFINKHKNEIMIKILSDNHSDWEKEEINQISKYSSNDLLNICEGGKNNRNQKPFELQTKEEHLLEINKSLSEMNRFNKLKGKTKRFKLLTQQEIYNISNGIFS